MTARVRALFAILDARTGGAFSREYDLISGTQWVTGDQIVELQIARLRQLVAHAERYVPFYSRRFAEYGVRSVELRDLADFRRFPLLEKRDVVLNAADLLATDGRSGLTRKATGGSTGERVVFYRDATAMARNFAHVLRNYTWGGFTPGEPHAFLWGAHFDLRAQQKFSNKLINFCLRQRWLDAFQMNSSSMSRYYDELRKFRPRLLSAYVTAAATLADYIRDTGRPPLDIPAITTTAESLFPEHRARIASVLGRAVFDRLGCREIGNTAHECSAHEGLHINAEHVVVEVLDDRGGPVAAGHEGELVYTSLGNEAFPLIRYRVGDYGVAAEDQGNCRCGRGLPKLAKVRGRLSDMLVASDGTKVHGEFVSHLFYKTPAVREFRVLQETMDRVQVWVRPQDGKSLPSDQRKLVEAGLRAALGADTDIAISVVDEIPRAESGKHRFTESRVGVGTS